LGDAGDAGEHISELLWVNIILLGVRKFPVRNYRASRVRVVEPEY
jgi:hypothetical protein